MAQRTQKAFHDRYNGMKIFMWVFIGLLRLFFFLDCVNLSTVGEEAQVCFFSDGLKLC